MSWSAMSRASDAGWPSRSGSTVPSTEQPVRITSIGCALAGTSSSASDTIAGSPRSEEHTSELQSLMRISYAVFCLQKKNKSINTTQTILLTIDHQQIQLHH